MKLKNESYLAIIVFAFFLWFAINMSPQILGLIYSLMALSYGWVLISKELPEFPISRTPMNISKILFIGMALVVGWIFVLSATSGFFGQTMSVIGPNSVINLLASQTAPPLITSNVWIAMFVFGILVPIAETFFFFGVMLPFVEDILKQRGVNMTSKTGWIVASIIIAAIMGIFHYVASMYTDFALMADFVFAFLSGMVVLYFRQLKEATAFHALANIMILLSKFGLI